MGVVANTVCIVALAVVVLWGVQEYRKHAFRAELGVSEHSIYLRRHYSISQLSLATVVGHCWHNS